jgi:hypothetical protein
MYRLSLTNQYPLNFTNKLYQHTNKNPKKMQTKQVVGIKHDNCSPQRFGNKKLSNGLVKTPSLLFYRPNTSSVIKTKSTQGNA